MANKIFRPRRGKKATMVDAGTVLAKGEMFFEVPDNGVGTGTCRIKMGDGTTAYSSLPYAINLDDVTTDVANTAIDFTASTTTSQSTLLTEIVSGKTTASLFGSVKTLLSSLVSSVTSLNNDLAELSDQVSSGTGSGSSGGGTINTETGVLTLSSGVINTETGVLSL